jgi:hypothetical protein
MTFSSIGVERHGPDELTNRSEAAAITLPEEAASKLSTEVATATQHALGSADPV